MIIGELIHPIDQPAVLQYIESFDLVLFNKLMMMVMNE
jgi:hypothetical protein